MPWNVTKCTAVVGGVAAGPIPFNAAATVTAANFANSVYVATAFNPTQNYHTRYAYTMVAVGAWTICVVGHIHILPDGTIVPGNCFIPGWDTWGMPTPPAAVTAIAALVNGGTFPVNRYPH
jgi:hypothetical protein